VTKLNAQLHYFLRHRVLPGDKTQQATFGLLPGWLDEYILIICSLSAFVGATVQ
jgi:hypothetical protein